MTKVEKMVTVINADGLLVGRLSTHVAKMLLSGEEVAIVNAEKALISGSRSALLTEFRDRRERGSVRKGPYYPKLPDRILRRSVRGMLPYRKPRGKDAFTRLHVFIGTPAQFAKEKAAQVPGASKPGIRNAMRLGDISKVLGAEI